MTNVSKRKLPDAQFAALFNQLIKVTSSLETTEAANFYDSLLGPEEKIMLVKRFAAVVMFKEGNTPYRVSQLLLISPSTAEKIHFDYEMGRYRGMVKYVKKKKTEYKKFWMILEKVLEAGMPPRGRGRWKSVLGGTKPSLI